MPGLETAPFPSNERDWWFLESDIVFKGIFRTSLVACFALVVAGCAPQAAYVRPTAPIASVWPEIGESEVDLEARLPSGVSWQVFFSDPTLQNLINQALDNNRDLRLALARVEEARAQYGLVDAERQPAINLGVSSATSRISGNLTSAKSQDASRRDVGLSLLSFEIDFWGRLASLSDAARANYLATEEGGRSARLSLIAEVANAYLTLLASDERLLVAEETVNAWEQTVDLVARGLEHGAASRMDLLQAEAALATSISEFASLRRQRGGAFNALVYLVGTGAEDLPRGMALRLQRINVEIAAGIPAETLLSRPDIIAAEQRLIAAHANIDAARAAFLPRIMLTAGLGLASPALSSLFSSLSQSWSYQPSLSLPIFDGGRASANLDIAEARRNVAIADYERTIQQAFREVADLLLARKELAVQRVAIEALATARAERLDATQARNRAGAASVLDVLEARRSYQEAMQAVIQVQRAHLSTAAQLYKALGGGLEMWPSSVGDRHSAAARRTGGE